MQQRIHWLRLPGWVAASIAILLSLYVVSYLLMMTPATWVTTGRRPMNVSDMIMVAAEIEMAREAGEPQRESRLVIFPEYPVQGRRLWEVIFTPLHEVDLLIRPD